MAETKRKMSKGGRIGGWIMVGLLSLAMVGFGGAGLLNPTRTVGSVGSTDIPIFSYVNVFTQAVNSAQEQLERPITVDELETFGINQAVLENVISTAAIQEQAAQWGISMDNAWLAQRLVEIPGFQSLDGRFDETIYRNSLRNRDITIPEFERNLRADGASSLVREAVIAGIALPEIYANTIVGYLTEERDFIWARIDDSTHNIKVAEPTDENLQTFYDENNDLFQTEPFKRLTYVWAAPEQVMDQVTVTDAQIELLFEERKEELNTPALRLAERLVFESQSAAQEAYDAITSQTLTFEEAVEARGLTLADVDIGGVSELDLAQSAAPVFALTEPGLTAPVETQLGFALFRVNAIIDEQITTLSDVQEQLTEELATEKAIALLDNEIDFIEDLLASGATLAEIADESIMRIGTYEWTASTEGGIADDPAFRREANRVADNSLPRLINLEDGGYFAVQSGGRQDEILKPFDDIKDEVRTAWQANQKQTLLRDIANVIKTRWDGGEELEEMDLRAQTSSNTLRQDSIDGTPPAFVNDMFGLNEGDSIIIDDVNGVIIARLDRIHPVNLQSSNAQPLFGIIENNISEQLSQEIYQSFANAVRDEYRIRINNNTLNYVQQSIGFAGRLQ